MKKSEETSIFFSDEWLEILYANQALITMHFDFKESQLSAYFVRKKTSFVSAITIPNLMPYNLNFRHNDQSSSAYTLFKKESGLIEKFTEELRNYHFARWKHSINYDTVSPYPMNQIIRLWRQVCFISKDENCDQLLESMYYKTRNHITTETQAFDIIKPNINDIQFLITQDKYYAKQIIPVDNIINTISYFEKQNIIQNFAIRDNNNAIHSIAILVQDHDTIYYWMNINNPNSNSRDANSKLLWHCIKFANNLNCNFNFDGSNHYILDNKFRSFGASIKNYPEFIYTKNKLMRILYNTTY